MIHDGQNSNIIACYIIIHFENTFFTLTNITGRRTIPPNLCNKDCATENRHLTFKLKHYYLSNINIIILGHWSSTFSILNLYSLSF